MPSRKTIERDVLTEIRRVLKEEERTNAELEERKLRQIPKVRLNKTLEIQGIDGFTANNLLNHIQLRRPTYERMDLQPLIDKAEKAHNNQAGEIEGYAHLLTPKQIINYLCQNSGNGRKKE